MSDAIYLSSMLLLASGSNGMLKSLALLVPPVRRLYEHRNMLLDILESDRAAKDGCEALVSARSFPVFVVGGRSSYSPRSSAGISPLIVITTPKSGTYLVAEFLKRIGLVDTEVHLDEAGFSDYRNKPISDRVVRFREYRRVLPLSESVKLVIDGQFAVGHLGFAAQTVETLESFNKICLVREVRAGLVSMMRWLTRDGRSSGQDWLQIDDPKEQVVAFLHCEGFQHVETIRSMSGWISESDVPCFKFEDLLGAKGDISEWVRLANCAGVKLTDNAARRIVTKVVGHPTKTWSGDRTNLDQYWSDRAERLFRRLGGPNLNMRLGYDPGF